jgi:hypothetical protein
MGNSRGDSTLIGENYHHCGNFRLYHARKKKFHHFWFLMKASYFDAFAEN